MSEPKHPSSYSPELQRYEKKAWESFFTTNHATGQDRKPIDLIMIDRYRKVNESLHIKLVSDYGQTWHHSNILFGGVHTIPQTKVPLRSKTLNHTAQFQGENLASGGTQ